MQLKRKEYFTAKHLISLFLKKKCFLTFDGLEPKQDMFKTAFPVILVSLRCGVSWCRFRISKNPFCAWVIRQGKRRLKQSRWGIVAKTYLPQENSKILQKSDRPLSFQSWTSFQRYLGLRRCFLHFIMAARKQTAHFDKSKFVLFSVFGRFC